MNQGPPHLRILRRIEASKRIPIWLKRPVAIGWILGQDLQRCDLMKQAGAMAYVTLLSIVPSLAAVFVIISMFSPMAGGDGALIDRFRAFVLENLAAGSGENAVQYLDKLTGNLSLRSIGWTSFAGLLFTLILLLRQIEGALNRIWLIRKGRNVVTRFIYFWTFLTLGTLALVIAAGVSGGFGLDQMLSNVSDNVGKSNIGNVFIGWASGFAVFLFLYRVVPNTRVPLIDACVGAGFSSFLLYVAGKTYGLFVQDFSNYESIYGALATLPVFLIWLYICWVIILLGAVLTWRMQQGFPLQKEDDTLDAVRTPQERLRNLQLKAVMPILTLVSVYRNFQSGSGVGLAAADLVQAMKVPVGWVSDALDTLEALGYIVTSQTQAQDGLTETTYFPAYPAESIKVASLMEDIERPGQDWLLRLREDLQVDALGLLEALQGSDRKRYQKMSLAEAIESLPSLIEQAPAT